jgi:hypothetical protein
MRKKIIIIGVVVLLVGFLFELLSGFTFPGGFTFPLIYGSNQILWIFVSFVGLIVGIVGLILKKK